MKKITLLVFCLFTSLFLIAQKPSSTNSITLIGKVIDADTKELIKFES